MMRHFYFKKCFYFIEVHTILDYEAEILVQLLK